MRQSSTRRVGHALAIVLAAAATSVIGASAKHPNGAVFTFWAKSDDVRKAKRDNRNLVLDEHPCGSVVRARVAMMPAANDPMLEPDSVTEYSAEGRPVAGWRVPVDGWPVAIDGHRVLVEANDVRYWFGLDGRFSPAAKSSDFGRHSEASTVCYKLAKPPRSDSSHCVAMHDERTGTKRFLKYGGVCS